MEGSRKKDPQRKMILNRRQKKKKPATLNMLLLLILGAIVCVVIIFIDELSVRFKTPDPRIWFGLETLELTTDIKKQYDIQSHTGLLVSRVFIGSPAQTSGIKEGDVIRLWNGISVTNQDQLQYLIQTSAPGSRVTVMVDRVGKPVLVHAQVGLRP